MRYGVQAIEAATVSATDSTAAPPTMAATATTAPRRVRGRTLAQSAFARAIAVTACSG